MIELLAILLLLGFIPAFLAHRKGRSLALWLLYGVAIFVVALPHALLIEADPHALGQRKCPFCAEFIKLEARVCRYCQRELPELPELPVSSQEICGVCSRPSDAHQRWCSRSKVEPGQRPATPAPVARSYTPPPWEKKP